MIDQRRLPTEERYVECRTHVEVADAIRTLVIRGAPAIGVAAAFGIVLGIRSLRERAAALADFDRMADLLIATRPTAVNLSWAVARMRRRFADVCGGPGVGQALLEEALAIETE